MCRQAPGRKGVRTQDARRKTQDTRCKTRQKKYGHSGPSFFRQNEMSLGSIDFSAGNLQFRTKKSVGHAIVWKTKGGCMMDKVFRFHYTSQTWTECTLAEMAELHMRNLPAGVLLLPRKHQTNGADPKELGLHVNCIKHRAFEHIKPVDELTSARLLKNLPKIIEGDK